MMPRNSKSKRKHREIHFILGGLVLMKNSVTKKHQRMVAFILVCIISLSMCTSCGIKGTVAEKDGKTVISVGSWPQKSGPSLEKIERQKAEFEADNPDVIIQPDSWTFDLKTFYPKAEAGLLPTLYYTFFTELAQVINAEYAADITAVLNKRGYKDKFNPKIMDLISRDNKVFAFPYSAYVLGLAYNTELFRQAGLMEADGTPKQPKTWNELAEFAQKIKQATGKAGFVFPTANNVGGWIFTCLAWSFGVKFIDKNAEGKWIATFNSLECVEALQFIKDLRWKYDVLPANTLIDGNEYYKLYATGNAGMLIAAGDVGKKCAPYEMPVDHIGIMALPAGPARHVTLMGGGVYLIANNATEKQKDAAVRWIEKRGYGYELTEDAKQTIENNIKEELEKGYIIGIKSMSVWAEDTEIEKYKNAMIEKYANSNMNHVRLYNEFVQNRNVEVQPEEPVCAQDLYGVLDNCIQEVLLNENADCARLIENACNDFQVNYLDNLDY